MNESNNASVQDATTDAERGRAFLERLRQTRFGSDWDKAATLIYNVLHHGDRDNELRPEALAALGRILREST